MALKRKQLQMLFQKIVGTDHKTFANMCKQLFNYLNQNAGGNSAYKKFEESKTKWSEWPEERSEGHYFYSWELPSNFEDVKELAYELYSNVADTNDNGDELSFRLFLQERFDDNIYKFNNTFIEYLGEALDEILDAEMNETIPNNDSNTPQLKNTVFIVHGHDDFLKKEVQLLLYQADVENIVLHEQPDKGRTIIEKLIDESSIAGYAIALLTPDDITDLGNKRARQNVILEIGYFLGKLGTGKVRMVVKNNIEIPSDLTGILYDVYDENNSWKIKLLKEIQEAGIPVNIQKAISKF